MATSNRESVLLPALLRYAGEMGGSQFVTISQDAPSRRWRKALLFAILLLSVAWNIFSREWDYHAAYSGVIVEKGMDCGISCLLGRRHRADLYIVLRDEQGKKTKRYVGTDLLYSETRAWNDLTVGSFVVKSKGLHQFPREPGAKYPFPASQSSATSNGWLLLIILPSGALLLSRIRQLWREL